MAGQEASSLFIDGFWKRHGRNMIYMKQKPIPIMPIMPKWNVLIEMVVFLFNIFIITYTGWISCLSSMNQVILMCEIWLFHDVVKSGYLITSFHVFSMQTKFKLWKSNLYLFWMVFYYLTQLWFYLITLYNTPNKVNKIK